MFTLGFIIYTSNTQKPSRPDLIQVARNIEKTPLQGLRRQEPKECAGSQPGCPQGGLLVGVPFREKDLLHS